MYYTADPQRNYEMSDLIPDGRVLCGCDFLATNGAVMSCS